MRSLMKRYLTGIDWVINAMDYSGKRSSGIGNVSQIVLELDSKPDAKDLEAALNNFVQKFPLVFGASSRSPLNLCPYWQASPNHKVRPLRINVTQLSDEADCFSQLVAEVNAPFVDNKEHLVFHLCSTDKRSFLGMTFDHRILDARGAEAFLEIFQHVYQKEPVPKISLDEPLHLNRWLTKFMAGRQVNRAFLNPSGNDACRFPAVPDSRVCKFKVIQFDPVCSLRFADAAFAQAGYLMLMPYALAKAIVIMQRIFRDRNLPGRTFVIPVSIDSRPQKRIERELFFNHASFFLFKIEAKSSDNFQMLLSSIKEQMYEQVKSGFPAAIENASFLLRIAPLRLVNLFLQFMVKNNFFSFSFVASAVNVKKFMRQEVRNIYHLPRVPNPPGIGIFFNQFGERLNATLSYFEGVLSDDEAGQISAALDALGDEM